MSHAYAMRTAQMSQDTGLFSRDRDPYKRRDRSEAYTCRMFMSRIVTGIYTAGSSNMRQPPIDPAGAKGEHFHSLVGESTFALTFYYCPPSRHNHSTITLLSLTVTHCSHSPKLTRRQRSFPKNLRRQRQHPCLPSIPHHLPSSARQSLFPSPAPSRQPSFVPWSPSNCGPFCRKQDPPRCVCA